MSVICDKHGGRDFTRRLVQHYFPEWLVEARCEGNLESRYVFGPAETRTTISFRCRGERALPVALASMTAKYLRELAMRAFNDYWCRQLPELRPRPAIRKMRDASSAISRPCKRRWESTIGNCGG